MESSAYDTRAPERQTITMTRLNAAGQRLGGEAVEITLSNLRGDPAAGDSMDSNQFCTSELYRQACRGCPVQHERSYMLSTQKPLGHSCLHVLRI